MKGKLIHAIKNGTLDEFLEQEGHALNRAELRIVLKELNTQVHAVIPNELYMAVMNEVAHFANEQIYN